MPTWQNDAEVIQSGFRILQERRARKLDRDASLHPDAAKGIVRPAENERLTAGLHQQSFDQHSRITIGRIVYALPYAHWYRVQMDVGQGELACCMMTETGLQPLGVRNTSPLPPMTRVLVVQLHGQSHGTILGALPRLMTPGAAILPDCISQGGGSGLRRERYYNQFPELFARLGDMLDFSSNRPVDATSVGEWGRITDLGSGVFIDPFMQWFRVDELCGLQLFYMDRLARLAAYNYDFRSAVSEQVIRNDNGEALNYAGSTPYPWEALGALRLGEATRRETPDEDVNYNSPLAKFEPSFDDQQPFYRLEEFRDYLGQAYMRHVQVPVDDSSATVHRFSQTRSGHGVFREQIALDGGYVVSSAHSLHFTKRLLLPIPKRNKLPEDQAGDDLVKNNDYKSAGHYGEGKPHVISDGPTAPATAEIPWAPAAVLDILAYAQNWKSLHPFHYHAKDFTTPQQTELAPFSTSQAALDFSQLQKQQWLPLPEPKQLKIDHRYVAKFYELMSMISMLPDGSVVIRGGGGCEIKLAGGTVSINAPGDIMQQSGRHTINYAGDDAIIKARNSVDITTSQHDVHIKAQRNLDMMAGNSGSGRLLLDCRAASAHNDVVNKQGEDVRQNGLILSAPNSNVSLLAGQQMYLRTGSGQITVDAAKGEAAVRVTASQVINYARNGFTVVVAGSGSPIVHSFGALSQIQSGLTVGGLLFTQAGIQAHGNITAVDGQAGASNAGDIGHAQNIQTHAKIDQGFTKTSQAFQTDYTNQIENVWYSDDGIGNDTIIVNTQFAPRTEAQMNAAGFKLPETAWQQLGAGLPIWEETVIVYQGLEMMPHPGLDNWKTKKALVKTQLNLHDVATGRDNPRGELYEQPPTGSFEELAMAEHYQVVGDA